MSNIDDIRISHAIMDTYHEILKRHLESDVLIVGAGPSGLIAAADLAGKGYTVTIFERKLAPGGGIWGGGMGMNVVVIQEEALSIIEAIEANYKPISEGLYTVDAVELASCLTTKAVQAGAALLNLVTMEDVRMTESRVSGLVVNRTGISGIMHVDPITFSSKAVIDATGHDANVVKMLAKRGLPEIGKLPGELAMDAANGEKFVVERTGEIYPGLWVTGMSVCTVYGGPRMGPIFGGMLLSGRRVAEMIEKAIESH